jgi:1,4-dihydroxy-2-naphthoate polyprenyltransferase
MMHSKGVEIRPITTKQKSKHFSYRFSWLHLMRPLILSGTISPILVGTGIAASVGSIRYDIFFALLVAAILVQSSANLFNDYFDFKHGQDQEKWAESYGREHHRPMHSDIPYIAVSMIMVAVLLGAWISSEASWMIALVGTISIIAGILYSAGKHSFASLGLGELVAAVFLGMVTTILGYVVQGHTIDLPILLVALTFALLISVMILTNNIRDLQKDQGFRYTLPMRLKKKNAVRLLTVILWSMYSWVVVLIFYQIVPITALLVFVAVPIARKLRASFQSTATRADEIAAMGIAAKHHWVFGLLFAVGIWLGNLG